MWIAITKKFEIIKEFEDDGTPNGRPVDAGNNGELAMIAQQGDYGHNVAIDLVNGIVFLEYEKLDIQNGTIEVHNPKVHFYIAEETNIAGDLMHRYTTEPDEKGDYFITYEPIIWRPIWFRRITNGIPAFVIGAQTTLPKDFGGRNVKKLISLHEDGRISID